VIRLGLLSQAGALAEARAANLGGLAHVNPLLKFVQLRGGPRAVARHLLAAQGADNGIGVLGDIRVIEQIKGGQRFHFLVNRYRPRLNA
jgi:hypothetical protein